MGKAYRLSGPGVTQGALRIRVEPPPDKEAYLMSDHVVWGKPAETDPYEGEGPFWINSDMYVTPVILFNDIIADRVEE